MLEQLTIILISCDAVHVDMVWPLTYLTAIFTEVIILYFTTKSLLAATTVPSSCIILEHLCLYRAPDGNVVVEQKRVIVTQFPHEVAAHRCYRIRRVIRDGNNNAEPG